MTLIKSFGSVLRDNTQVATASFKFKAVKRPERIKDLPKNFDGRIIWRNYLTRVKAQGSCGNCWAVASTAVLSDRFSIMTLNQINTELSPLTATLCSEVINPKPEFDENAISQANLIAHSTAACNGNSILNALSYLYVYGATEAFCNLKANVQKLGFKYVAEVKNLQELPQCQELYGKEFDECAVKGVAARYFRSMGTYIIPNDITQIKEDIYQFGPVVSGYIIYSDFLEEYDGKSIYMGPKKGATPQGGHAIRVVGWGEEEVNGEVVPYWWIANSWGEEWGLGGYFKMKMNIKECELESNFAAMIPDIYGLKIPDYVSFENTAEEAIMRRQFRVNPQTGYLLSAERKIKEKKLIGFLDPFVHDAQLLPDFKKVYAALLPAYTDFFQSKVFLTLDERDVKRISYKYAILIFLIIILLSIYIIKK